MTNDNHSSGRGVLDDELIEELREDMEDEFGEVIESFLDEVPGWLAKLTQALADSNAEQLFQTAHSLKSSSGYMGRGGSVEGCEPFLAELMEEYKAVEPRLRELAAS